MKKEKHITPRSVGTHDGSFHADEVTACALLILFDLVDKDKIKRSRDRQTLNYCEYVCDVGGVYDPAKKRFDHHQMEYEGCLSSAGMILLYLKERGVIDKELYDHFNNNLIIGVDAHDNGTELSEKGVYTFSHIIANFQPVSYHSTIRDYQHHFFEALEFTLDQLTRMKARFDYIRSVREKVRKCMAESNYVLIFDESLPWMDNFFHLGGELHPALFVIMPSGSHWKLRGIPPNLEQSMKVRFPLPKEWAGLHNAELQEVSGLKGGIFCHKGRFISIWETKEDALHALHVILKDYKQETS